MRTTVTLDADVAAQIEAERRRSRRSFKDVVNDALRRGLAQPSTQPKRQGSVTRPVTLALRATPDVADISEAITQAEGDHHR